MKLSTDATEINYVTCNYGNFVPMATEIYLYRLAVDSTQALYLEHISPGETTISGGTCCLQNLAAMAAENYFYYSGI